MRRFHDWWFAPASPVAWGTFRIAMGLAAVLTLLLQLPDFVAWFSEDGFVPSSLITPEFGTAFRFNPLVNVASTTFTAIWFFVTVIAAILTTLGLFTRFASIVLAVGIMGLHHRNPVILNSGDTLLRLSVMALAFGPSGAALSIDRLRARWHGETGPVLPVSIWPQRVVAYQVALVYGATLWWKVFGTYWKDGTATWYPTQMREFDRFPVPGFVDTQPFIAFTTYATLAIELALCTIVFYKPLRRYAIIAGLLLHLGIEYRFNIPMFAFTILSCYLCFYEGDEISAWYSRLVERLKHRRVAVPLPSDVSTDRADVLASASWARLVTYAPSSEPLTMRSVLQSWIRTPAAWLLTPWGWRRVLEAAKA